MDRSYMRKYDIGAAPWNALSKSDFLAVAARLSAEVAADPDGSPPRVAVSVSWADADAEMTLEEFTRNFSASSSYRYLTIKVYSRELSIYSRFGAPRADHSFLLSSPVLTDAELEYAADALETFFVALFRKYEPELPEPPTPKPSAPEPLVPEPPSKAEEQEGEKPSAAQLSGTQSNNSRKALFTRVLDWVLGRLGAFFGLHS